MDSVAAERIVNDISNRDISVARVMESNVMQWAHDELHRAGLFDTDSMYGDLLGRACEEMLMVFVSQGHSGMSAPIVAQVFYKLMRWLPLTPLTNDPAEWMDHGNNQWQSRRRPDAFSNDAGKTWYSVDDAARTLTTSEAAP